MRMRSAQIAQMTTQTLFYPGALLVAAVIMAGNVGCAGKKSGENLLQAQAKISETQAQARALAQVPNGVIESEELEKDNGRLIWAFDISPPDTTGVVEDMFDAVTDSSAGTSSPDSAIKVDVNAITGDIVSVEPREH